MKEKKLGRGLEFLLGETPSPRTDELTHLAVAQVTSNPFQPRKEFSTDEIESLANSIRKDGLLQPIVVRRREQLFELVAGERRLRACKSIGWGTIPAVVVDISDSEMLMVALVENLLRKDLNPMERAAAFHRLQRDFTLSHDQIGERLGLDRSTVANFVRLLELPQDIQEHVSRGTISMGHARALLGIADPNLQRALCTDIIKDRLTVRDVERRASRNHKGIKKKQNDLSRDLVQDLETRLQEILATKVTIQCGRRRGKIIIEYYGNEDLDRLVGCISNIST